MTQEHQIGAQLGVLSNLMKRQMAAPLAERFAHVTGTQAMIILYLARAANALCLEQLAAWVAAQSAAGEAPHFGGRDRETETLSAAGALESVSDEGTAVYAVTLQADYTVQCNEGGNT